jgi:predicted Zn-dependent protease
MPHPVKKASAPPPPVAKQKYNPSYVDQIRTENKAGNVNKPFIGLVLILTIGLGAYYLKNVFSIDYSKEKITNISMDNTASPIESKVEKNTPKEELTEQKVDALPLKEEPTSAPFVADQYLAAVIAADWPKVEMLIASAPVTSLRKGNRKAARKLNEQAILELKNNNPAKATTLLNEAFVEDPSDMEVRNNLGFSQLKSGDLIAAKKTYLETLSYTPTRSITWGNLAEIYADEGAIDSATAALRLEVYLANDKKKAIASLQKISESENPEMRDNKLTKIITKELTKFSDIPDRK